jgi:hypothetical protein
MRSALVAITILIMAFVCPNPALAQISEEDVLEALNKNKEPSTEQPLELTPIPRLSDTEILQLSAEGKAANERITTIINQMSMVIQICTSEINLQRNWALIVTCKELMDDFADTLEQFNQANVNRTLSIMLGSIP